MLKNILLFFHKKYFMKKVLKNVIKIFIKKYKIFLCKFYVFCVLISVEVGAWLEILNDHLNKKK